MWKRQRQRKESWVENNQRDVDFKKESVMMTNEFYDLLTRVSSRGFPSYILTDCVLKAHVAWLVCWWYHRTEKGPISLKIKSTKHNKKSCFSLENCLSVLCLCLIYMLSVICIIMNYFSVCPVFNLCRIFSSIYLCYRFSPSFLFFYFSYFLFSTTPSWLIRIL